MRRGLMAGQVQTGSFKWHTHAYGSMHTHIDGVDELNMGGLCLGGWQEWHKVNDIHYSQVDVSLAKATYDLSPQEVHPKKKPKQ